jgi:hypothetical protein
MSSAGRSSPRDVEAARVSARRRAYLLDLYRDAEVRTSERRARLIAMETTAA